MIREYITAPAKFHERKAEQKPLVAKLKKLRVDDLLVEAGLAADKQEAVKLVMAGMVRTGPDAMVKKASDTLPEDTPLFVDAPSPYVSRGAYKLLDALERNLPSLNGMICLDVGSSTGGFTDLMLQKGAEKIYASDVGKGQLHAKIRNDPRVVALEGVNVKDLSEKQIDGKVDVITADVSFISATRVLEPCDLLLKEKGWAFILVKPQFEAERRDTPHGVVIDEAVRQACVNKVKAYATAIVHWSFIEALPCKIKGPKGNQEFMAVFRKGV